MPISPERFWDAFADQFRRSLAGVCEWRNLYTGPAPLWTTFATAQLREVGKALGFDGASNEISTEYYRVDMIYARNLGDLWRWNLEVAIEHENDPRFWLDEWVKLLHLRSGLNVIISYCSYSRRKPEDELERALELLGALRLPDRNAPFLVILGPTDPGTIHDYRAWKLDFPTWQPLNDRRILPARGRGGVSDAAAP